MRTRLLNHEIFRNEKSSIPEAGSEKEYSELMDMDKKDLVKILQERDQGITPDYKIIQNFHVPVFNRNRESTEDYIYRLTVFLVKYDINWHPEDSLDQYTNRYTGKNIFPDEVCDLVYKDIQSIMSNKDDDDVCCIAMNALKLYDARNGTKYWLD